MNEWFFRRVGYPLVALITMNTRFVLLSKRVVFPFLVFMVPAVMAMGWRVIYILTPPPLGSDAANSFFMYSEIISNLSIQFIIPLIALILGTSSMAGVIEDGTYLFLRLRPVPRTVIVSGKFLAYVASTFLLLAFSLSLTFAIMSSLPGSDMFPGDLPALFRGIWVFSLSLAVYGAVMMMLGIAFKHSFLMGIMLLFVWENFAVYIPGTTYQLTIRHYTQSLLPEGGANSLLPLLNPHPPATKLTALCVLFAVMAVAILLTTLILKRKELTGKEQEG